ERLKGIEAFVCTAEAGSFTAAAERLNLTNSAVGKAVARLEARLGVRLLQRTTRALSLTDDGRLYHERVSRLLVELEEAEALLAGSRGLRGTLRVSAPAELGRTWVAEVVRDFLVQHPELRIELQLTDRLVDLVDERIDVAVRVGRLPSSSLIARRLGEVHFTLSAAPRYLRRAGTPRHPSQLAEHACLRYLSGGLPLPWSFLGPEGPFEVPVRGPLDADSGAALRVAAVAGLGVLRALDVLVREEVAAGRLRLLLPAFTPPPLPVQAVFTPTRNLAPAVHAFVAALDAAWTGAR
ncbi:MAG TPA: LysR family transcriptional regulator, partial [Aggregicoccus sp.]|nr:LysR family transcriptional regulator [Aggregicoccus sp.]